MMFRFQKVLALNLLALGVLALCSGCSDESVDGTTVEINESDNISIGSGDLGTSGNLGASGNLGGSLTSTPAENYAVKACSQFEFDESDETAKAQRQWSVRAVDERGDPYDGSTLAPVFAYSEGCADILIWRNELNEITLSSTGDNEAPVVRYHSDGGADGDLAQTAALMFSPLINVASDYLAKLISLKAYDVHNAGLSAFLDYYAAAESCRDLLDDWEDDELIEDGINSLVGCLETDLAHAPFATNDGGLMIQPTVYTSDFADSGAYTNGADIGMSEGLFEATNDGVANTAGCLMSKFNGATVTHSVVSFGDTIAADETTSCLTTEYDNDRLEGIFGQKTNAGGDADKTALWGFVRLAKGQDRDESEHQDISAGIFFVGGEAADSSDGDIDLSSGDSQTVSFGDLLDGYDILALSNPPDEFPDTGHTVDTDTEWLIFKDFNEAIADDNNDYEADQNWFEAEWTDVNNDLLLVQECNPHEDIELSVVKDTVTMTLDDFSVSAEDDNENRLFAGFMLVVHFDVSDAVGFAAIAEAAFDAIEECGAPCKHLTHRDDVLENGAITTDSMPPSELARLIAESRALCNKAVVSLNTRDDIVVGKAIPWPNVAVSGLAPNREYNVTGCANLGGEERRADRYGVAAFGCYDDDGVSPLTATISYGAIIKTVNVQ